MAELQQIYSVLKYRSMKDVFHKDKKEFQIERLILFSDAVFAIAITLLILEIKAPEMDGKNISDAGFWQAFLPSVPKFIGFIMSFAMIGLYWSKHHQMFGFVTDYTPKLIFLNLLLLFSIVLMPYSTAVYSDFSNSKYGALLLPFLFYTLNIVFVGVANFLLWNYIGNPKNKITGTFTFEQGYLFGAKLRALLLPFAFIVAFLFCWTFHSLAGSMLLFLIPFYFRLVRIFLHKKQKLLK